MNVTIYHNPLCGTSRCTLALIREKGIEPTIIEYLKTPLGPEELRALIGKMQVPVSDVVRWKQTAEVAAAGISEATDDDTLLAAMAAHPILMNRPIVVTDEGANCVAGGDGGSLL